VTALTLRLVFHLALRQTEGFVASLIRLMGLDLETPDHTTLSRRNDKVEVPPLAKKSDGPIHLVIDSTGLKIVGDGEWHAHRHKTSNKRRSWRKLHLGVDGDGFIVASELTDSGVDDASIGVAMLEENEARIARVTADGAYDTRAIYEALATVGVPEVVIVIPPRKTASRSRPAEETLRQRDAAIARIAEVGRQQWRKESGAHQQARADNGMFRFKRLLGDHLRSRSPDGQKTEAMSGVNILNRMTALGMPESVAVAA
jgi:IS5 family transposase